MKMVQKLIFDETVDGAVKCKKGAIINGDHGRKIFPVRDRFNRTIGVSYSCATVECVPAAEDARSWFRTMVPGTFYTLYTTALRDGKGYGAYQAERFFVTAEKRDAALSKYLKDAEKRALQKEGR